MIKKIFAFFAERVNAIKHSCLPSSFNLVGMVMMASKRYPDICHEKGFCKGCDIMFSMIEPAINGNTSIEPLDSDWVSEEQWFYRPVGKYGRKEMNRVVRLLSFVGQRESFYELADIIVDDGNKDFPLSDYLPYRFHIANQLQSFKTFKKQRNANV